jgi:nucleoside-diphosphate-sugar epimerase
MKDVDYVAHMAGLWLAEPLLKACEKQGAVKRVVFVGSTSRFTKLDSPDPHERRLANTMAEAEARIKSSPAPCVILWPTMIYGANKDRNIRQMIHWMQKWPAYPNIGGGKGVKNPVYAGDVAWAVAKCLFHEALPRNEYVIAGKEPIRQAVLLKAIRKALRKKAWLVPVPMWLGYAGVFLYRRLHPDTHINYAMVRRLNEDVDGSSAAAAKDFGYDPLSFEEGVARQVAYLERIGEI